MSAHISKEVILSDIKEWRDWIYQLEVYARGKEVWDYIKPTSDKLVEPTQPKRPEMIEMRGEEETAEDFRLRIELYKIEMENYKFDYESFREVKKGLAEVHSYIYSTIERGNGMYIRGETTVSGIVAKLKARFAMNPGLERWLLARHRLLLTPRRGTKPESFLPVSYDIN